MSILVAKITDKAKAVFCCIFVQVANCYFLLNTLYTFKEECAVLRQSSCASFLHVLAPGEEKL